MIKTSQNLLNQAKGGQYGFRGGRYWAERKRAASERGKRMAKARWEKFRLEQARLDNLDPIHVSGKIVERLVRIIGESRVIERTFYEFDRSCDWRRKRREIFRYG